MLAAAVLAWMGVLCVCDVRQRRLPNWLTLPGAAALAGVYLLVHLALPAAMGAGDVKLAIGLGGLTGCFGVEVWFLAALAAPLLTAVCGVMVTPWGVRTLPHGPSMCVASLGAVGLALLG
ncbi:prepilin signal peptidase PulO-like peptidase [Mycobacterium tuberculosis]|nr:prepilin signal peptidase PulO-like peptidase [Mycobacterium tuberculosis]